MVRTTSRVISRMAAQSSGSSVWLRPEVYKRQVWNKSDRCEYGISSKALARKESLNKIEFKYDQAYFVMAKYVEVGGRACVLEVVSKLSDGRWLDMGCLLYTSRCV